MRKLLGKWHHLGTRTWAKAKNCSDNIKTWFGHCRSQLTLLPMTYCCLGVRIVEDNTRPSLLWCWHGRSWNPLFTKIIFWEIIERSRLAWGGSRNVEYGQKITNSGTSSSSSSSICLLIFWSTCSCFVLCSCEVDQEAASSWGQIDGKSSNCCETCTRVDMPPAWRKSRGLESHPKHHCSWELHQYSCQLLNWRHQVRPVQQCSAWFLAIISSCSFKCSINVGVMKLQG